MTVNINNNRLVIPNKQDPGDPRNLEVIERWANSHVVNGLVAGDNVTLTAQEQTLTPYGNPPDTGIVTINATGGGGTHYASLTGAGETTTPGDLLQLGSFAVTSTSVTGGFQAYVGAGQVVLNANGGELLLASTGVALTSSGGANPLSIEAAGNLEMVGDIRVDINNGNALTGPVTIAGVASSLAFYGMAPAVTKQSVTGSRGGNAALASLLTALNALGLILDNTTS